MELNKIKFKSGDLLFFESNDFSSKIIKLFTNSKITHVGMIWKCPITKRLYVWESGDIYKNNFPIINRKNYPLCSAHLIPLSIKINKKYKNIYYKKLICKKKFNKLEFDKFIAKNIGKNYPLNIIGVWTKKILINLPFIEEFDEDLEKPIHKEWMCSQLILFTYYHLKIISEINSHTSIITPGDLFNNIITNDGFTFSKIILIYF